VARSLTYKKPATGGLFASYGIKNAGPAQLRQDPAKYIQETGRWTCSSFVTRLRTSREMFFGASASP